MKGKIKGKINDLNKIKGKKLTAILLIAVFILSTLTLAIPIAIAGNDDPVWIEVTMDGIKGTGETNYTTITLALAEAQAGDTIIVGSTYAASGSESFPIVIGGALTGLTLRGDISDPSSVVITQDATQENIQVQADDVIIEGFTLDNDAGDGVVIKYDTVNVTVQKNLFTSATQDGVGILLWYDNGSPTLIVEDATIYNNTFTGFYAGVIAVGRASGLNISDNVITGAEEGINLCGGKDALLTENVNITGNTITGSTTYGISLEESWMDNTLLVFEDILIEDNIISGTTGTGIQLHTGLTLTNLMITGNNISSSTDDGIEINSWTTGAIYLNDIVDNEDYGIDHLATGKDVNATMNWWGDPAGPGDKTEDSAHTNLIGAGSSIYMAAAADTIDYPLWLSTSIYDVYSLVSENPELDGLTYMTGDTVLVTVYDGSNNTDLLL